MPRDLATTTSPKRGRNKRYREDDENLPSGKRSKFTRLRPVTLERLEQDPFPFLQLPGELRNRIYEIAFVTASRTFPTSTFHKEHQPRLRSTFPLRAATLIPLPYLGLVQSCRQIRAEFYPLWLQSHRIPLGNTYKYLRTFFPARPKSNTDYYSSGGQLRILLSKSELDNRDLYPLIKHAIQFPNRDVTFIGGPTLELARTLDLIYLVRNRNPEWSRWFQSNMVSQVRLEERPSQHPRLVIVVKEKFSEPWMKRALGPFGVEPKKAAARLGLGELKSWEVYFNVDYR